jgi:hypothetical protein
MLIGMLWHLQVRHRLSDMLKVLHSNMRGSVFTTAIIAHGDYCDRDSTYITKHIDFCSDIDKLVEFVNSVEDTHGGDAPEAYEVRVFVFLHLNLYINLNLNLSLNLNLNLESKSKYRILI